MARSVHSVAGLFTSTRSMPPVGAASQETPPASVEQTLRQMLGVEYVRVDLSTVKLGRLGPGGSGVEVAPSPDVRISVAGMPYSSHPASPRSSVTVVVDDMSEQRHPAVVTTRPWRTAYHRNR